MSPVKLHNYLAIVKFTIALDSSKMLIKTKTEGPERWVSSETARDTDKSCVNKAKQNIKKKPKTICFLCMCTCVKVRGASGVGFLLPQCGFWDSLFKLSNTFLYL